MTTPAVPPEVETTNSAEYGTIVVSRKFRLLAAARFCGVLLDGNKIGTVSFRKKLTIQTSTGEHQLRARLSWVKSAPYLITVRPGETVEAQFALPRIFELHRILLGPFWGPLYFTWKSIHENVPR
jgi:hypothetical protein